jgi:RNA polymerase sigma factor (sigma-70 family)
MGLSKDQLAELIPKIMNNDNEAFEIFYKEYNQIVNVHVNKWFWAVKKATMGMYTEQDLSNEVWANILEKLHTYDPEKSQMSTYLYIICSTAISSITNYNTKQKRNPGEDASFISFEYELGESDNLTLGNIVTDPINIEEVISSEDMMSEYLYFFKDFMSELTRQQKIILLHEISGIPARVSIDVLQVSKQRVQQIKQKVKEKFREASSLIGKVRYSEDDNFISYLLSKRSDDQVSDDLSLDIETVKICRAILKIYQLYNREVIPEK